MDVKDRKILRELISNSRQPLSRIAKKVVLSREAVTYRFTRLKKENIREFYTLINLEALGYIRHTCFVQLGGLSSEEEKMLMDYLAHHKAVMWLGTITGRWNACFDIIAHDKHDFQNTLEIITKHIGTHLLEISVLSNVSEEIMFPTKIINMQSHSFKKIPHTTITPDATDKKILSLLSNNSRIDYVELGTHLDVSANAIKHRIKKMEKENIITGYTISFNYEAFGVEYHNVQLRFPPAQDNKEFLAFLKEHPNIFYYYQYTGSAQWDFDVGILVKNYHELRLLLVKLKEKFPVSITNTYQINSEIKGNYPPKKAFE